MGNPTMNKLVNNHLKKMNLKKRTRKPKNGDLSILSVLQQNVDIKWGVPENSVNRKKCIRKGKIQTNVLDTPFFQH